jgi:hypothetical protein
MIAILTPLSLFFNNLRAAKDQENLLGHRTPNKETYPSLNELQEESQKKKPNTGSSLFLGSSDSFLRPRSSSFQFYSSAGHPPDESKLRRYRKLSDCGQLSLKFQKKDPLDFEEALGSFFPEIGSENKIIKEGLEGGNSREISEKSEGKNSMESDGAIDMYGPIGSEGNYVMKKQEKAEE